MMLRDSAKTSIIWQGYCSSEEWLYTYFKLSRTYHLINKFWQRLKINLKYSFLVRYSRINQESRKIMDNSKFINLVSGLFIRCRNAIARYSKASAIARSIEEFKEAWLIQAIKTGSLLLIIAVFVYILCCLLFKNEITLYGYIVRTVLLLLGLAGIHSDVNWDSLKATSFFLNVGGNNVCKSKN